MKEKKYRHPKQTCKRSSPVEEQVLTAWKYGERDIYQIMEETGLSYKTIRFYIPVSEDD